MRLTRLPLLAALAFAPGCDRRPAESGHDRPADPGAVAITPGNVAELADHPERFKGKTLRVKALVPLGDYTRDRDKTLRGMAGADVPFAGNYGGAARLDLVAHVPKDLPGLPDAKPGDRLELTFRCDEGRLDRGNVAVKVTRD